jgi:glycolate oxidase FAD binding subunit
MIYTDLEKIVGKQRVQESSGYQELGNGGIYVVSPVTDQEIAEILKYANERGLSIIPVGGGSKAGYGGLEEKADILLSLADLKGIVEHSVGDMTMTVRAGTTMKEIADYLTEHKQMIPSDVMVPGKATIGGVIAANDSGPKRLRYGSARDFLIGLRVIYPDGRIQHTGGKTVKNVAGYDMNKLFVGSMGTLGIVSEVTVKLRPIPKYESVALLKFNSSGFKNLRAFVLELQDSMLEPVSLELLSPSLAKKLHGEEMFTLAVAFEDVEKSVHYQENWIQGHKTQGAELTILQQEKAREFWSAFARISPQQEYSTREDTNAVALKISSKNMDVIDIVPKSQALGETLSLQVESHGGTGHGISRVYLTGKPNNIQTYINEMRSFASERGGFVTVQHAPLPMRRQIDVWGPKPNYFPVLEGIKFALDPNKVLNRKRFVGGL